MLWPKLLPLPGLPFSCLHLQTHLAQHPLQDHLPSEATGKSGSHESPQTVISPSSPMGRFITLPQSRVLCVQVHLSPSNRPYTSGGRSWDCPILVDPEPQQCCQLCPLFFHPPVAKPLSLFSRLVPSIHSASCSQTGVLKHKLDQAPVLKPSRAFGLLLEDKADSVSCCRQDSTGCRMPFLCHFSSSRPLPQPHFLPGFSNEPGPFPLPGMFFPQPSACWFLFIFHFL